MVKVGRACAICAKIVAIVAVLALNLVGGQPMPSYAADRPEIAGISARYAVVLDGETGAVLWSKNGDVQVPPASTTKILTALLALDIVEMEREVEVSPLAAAVGESNVGLLAGERFRLGELLDAALLKSANDACVAIAEGAVGSEPLFVRLMNLKADALGAAGAYLLNTNGLPADGHTMSAHDLAELARVAMTNPEFTARVGAQTGLMEGGSYNRALKNTNKLLAMNEFVTGVKTGTTNAAGACLLSAMERGGRKVIAVVLNSGDRYGESLRLLNFGVDGFHNRALVRQGAVLGAVPVGRQWLSVRAAADLVVTLPAGFDGSALVVEYAWREVSAGCAVPAGEVLGTVYVSYSGETLGAVPLVAAGEYRPGVWARLFGE